MITYEAARVQMVNTQLRTSDVTSYPILSAFLEIPREAFVPQELKQFAYFDEHLQIKPSSHTSPARYLMAPMPIAKLLQLAKVDKKSKVLEIGAASGYVTALLSQLASSVVALESDSYLFKSASETLSSLGYRNVTIINAPLEAGYQPSSPYDVIFLNGSVETIPLALIEQLNENGRLIAVKGYDQAAKSWVYIKRFGKVSSYPSFNVNLKPLPGFCKDDEFIF
ncbi:Protein-L-isoaspartate O-methyltransferase [Liberibacter crescens BT-1]|uniref:Protein-L-isoaspartate O-methyltransferase n=1 Tax=Liberibacter crescens (strain BT-1) TaxID=1215343 RepID=L0EVH6_LIBCB|nr:protein-L-isoaspartate O-methyltransferase [Liberibacter crescens]AGA64962.1 Protein-L-isoaspartate O-methyltransferase [Liberibacter crescens BT-1]AMC12981.1 protein-L-isoaspartate O-methyltransferase [Liberibacter crescens]